jgi:hypothetical protein
MWTVKRDRRPRVVLFDGMYIQPARRFWDDRPVVDRKLRAWALAAALVGVVAAMFAALLYV